MPTQSFKVGELLNSRSLFSKTWINFDGSFTTELHTSQIHFEDEAGNLHNINTDLFDDADLDSFEGPVNTDSKDWLKVAKERAIGEKKANKLNRDNYDFSALQVPFTAKLPRNFRKGYSIGKDRFKLTFKPIGASPSRAHKDENNNCLIYQDAWNDADVCLELTATGVKETITLKTDRAPAQFSFEVLGSISDDLTAGLLALQPAWLEDANGEKRDVEQTIRREGDKTFVDLIADIDGLAYPIVVDPTVTIAPTGTAAKDAYVRASNPTENYNTTTLSIGNTPGEELSLIQFDVSSIFGVVQSATLTVTVSNRGANMNMVGYPITSSWTETGVTYNTRPSYDTNSPTNTVLLNSNGSPFDLNVTDMVTKWVNGTLANNGTLLRTHDTIETNVLLFSSSNDAYPERLPKLTVTYNQPPTTPTVIAPNGGETWNSAHTITWTASTDSETPEADMRYQIQLSRNNGATWKDLVALTAAGATSYNYDFINEQETSTAKIRIRAYDGGTYGSWDESNGVFTIQHNQAPSAPTNLSPSSGAKDRATSNRLSWQHNDANSDPQAQFDLQWRLQGSSTWNDVSQVTVNQYFNAPANTFPKGSIEWRVRTYDQAGLSSPYSSIAIFIAGDKPEAPIITSPGSTVSVANPTVQWSSVGQTGYMLVVKDSSGATIFSSERSSTNKAETITYDLANQSDYTIELSIKNAEGLYSDSAILAISVSYTPPSVPEVLINPATGHIVIDIFNPTPTGSEPNVKTNEVWKKIDGIWTKVAETLFQYRDYAVANKISYDYKIRTIGDNVTYTDSPEVRAAVAFQGVWLHDVTNPEGTVYEFKYDGGGKTSQWEVESAVMRFKGRKYPVVETGEMQDDTVSFDLTLLTDQEAESLKQLMFRRNILCYRDGRGRLLYGLITRFPLNDETWRGQTTSLEIMRVDFKEGV